MLNLIMMNMLKYVQNTSLLGFVILKLQYSATQELAWRQSWSCLFSLVAVFRNTFEQAY